MRALRCHGTAFPGDLVVEDIPVPEIQSGQARVRIVSCGISFPDLLIATGQYQIRPKPPFILGGEFAGTVIETSGSEIAVAPGDRVAGFVNFGAFAEEIVVDGRTLAKLPEAVSFEDAAAFILNYATAYSALRFSAKIREGEMVLVLGAGGGIGSAAVDIATALNVTVIAAASSHEKLSLAEELGAHHLVDYKKQNLREALLSITGEKGLDAIIDPVGGETSEVAFRRLGWRGRHIVLGFASADIPRLAFNLPLLKGASLHGLSVGELARREPDTFEAYMADLVAILAHGEIRPRITGRFPLEQIPEALSLLQKREVTGKLIASIAPSPATSPKLDGR